MIKALLRFSLVVVVSWLVACIVLAGAVYAYSREDRAEPADVIIVLGSALRSDNRPGPAQIRRATRAAELYLQGYAPVVICTGGYTVGRSRSEADGCREILEGLGVPAEAIVLEPFSRSTEENAFYAHEIMDEFGWQTALVVSDGYHLLRASWIFEMQGIPHSTSPSADPPRANHIRSVIREVFALHWQVIKRALNLPITYLPNL